MSFMSKTLRMIIIIIIVTGVLIVIVIITVEGNANWYNDNMYINHINLIKGSSFDSV